MLVSTHASLCATVHTGETAGDPVHIEETLWWPQVTVLPRDEPHPHPTQCQVPASSHFTGKRREAQRGTERHREAE